MTIKETDNTYVANTYSRYPIAIVEGKGSLLYDESGKRYIDMGTGIAVNTFGAADDQWIAAVTAQLGKVQHASNLYYTGPCAELAQMLCERTGMKKVFFANSGTEANECAIKVARKYAADKYGAERNQIITLINSFHGRTLAALAATGQEVFHKDFLPLMPGFQYVAAGDMAAIRGMAKDGTVAAVMVEMVQGEGGVMPLDPAFVTELAAFCKEQDILLIADEIQCGNGRTGALYCYMNYGVTPDVVTTAKGLAGGLPLGAAMMGEKTADVLSPGSHGSTFGGNPVACAGGVNILSRLDDALLAGVRERSEYIKSELTGAKGIKSVSGMGLMLGLETEAPAGDVIKRCMEKGVLPISAKNKVRLLPALNIPMDLLQEAVAVIKEACEEVIEHE